MSQAENHLIEIEDRLKDARANEDTQGEVNALTDLATWHLVNGKYEKALDALELSLILATKLEDRVGQGQVLNNIGVIYQEQQSPARARGYFEKALSIWEALGDLPQQATTCFNIATVSYEMGNLERARDYLQRVVAIHDGMDNGHPELQNERAALDQVQREIELQEFEAGKDSSGG